MEQVGVRERQVRAEMRVSFRPASERDFDYCAMMYFEQMADIIRRLDLDVTAHAADFRRRWEAAQVQIITLDGQDVGWLHSEIRDDALFLAQIFIDASFQRRGIGTMAMNRLIDDAAQVGRAVTLMVVKTNPAAGLYRRLGFRVTGEDAQKFHMKREPSA